MKNKRLRKAGKLFRYFFLLNSIAISFSPNIMSQESGIPASKSAADSISTDWNTGINLSAYTATDKTSSSILLNSEDLSAPGLSSLSDLLQGKVAGLDIISASGEPGTEAQLVFRGNSISGYHQPLIVIDGNPQYRLDPLINKYSIGTSDLRRMIPVNARDIKSLEFIKGSASTILYGSEGSDGVILIETKEGETGKIHLNYQFSQSIHLPQSWPEMLDGDQYIMMQLEAWHNREGVFEMPDELSYNPDYPDFYNYSANTNWLDLITQPASSYNHYLNLNGGNDKNRFFLSLESEGQKGPIINSGYKRMHSKLNFEHQFTKKLSLIIRSDFINDNYDGNPVFDHNILEMAFIKAPNMSNLEYNSLGELSGDYFTPLSNYQGIDDLYFNPVLASNTASSDKRINEFSNSAELRYHLNPWLTFRQVINHTYINAETKSYDPYYVLGRFTPDMGSPLNLTELKLHRLRSESQVKFRLPFLNEEEHMLRGSLSWLSDFNSIHADITRTNNVVANIAPIPQNKHAALSSLLYKWKDRYLFNVNTRLEAFSSILSGYTWDLHHGLSFGWKFLEEPFLKSSSSNSQSMLRIEWSSSVYRPDYSSIVHLPYLSARKKDISSFNGGLDLGLLKNKVHVEADLFYRMSEEYLSMSDESLIISRDSKGIDFSLDASIISTEKLKWNVRVNNTWYISVYNKLPENINQEQGTALGNGSYVRRMLEGEITGSIFGFISEGVYSTDEDAIARNRDGSIIYDGDGNPVLMSYKGAYTFQGGDAIYKDLNYDGVIDLNDITYLGNSIPKYTGGISSSLEYKNFALFVSFHYRLDYDIINQAAQVSEGMYSKDNQSLAVMRRWRVAGDNDPDLLPRAYLYHPANSLGSDRYVEPGGFIRLNYIQLSYNLNQDFCEKIKISNLAFVLSARNLYTFSSYTGMDVEIERDFTNDFWLGMDRMRVHTPKAITLSVQIGL